MKKGIIYIHGKGGTAKEAEHYKPLFADADIIGFDYKAQTHWEAEGEFALFFDSVSEKYGTVAVIGNSIGAFFAMTALQNKQVETALFISPVVNMEKLITDMMMWAKITEEELCARKEIETTYGETLSWKYLCDVREHPVTWNVPTRILYGEKDHLTSYETMLSFTRKIGAELTVMENGEHWFHTEEQMRFLDDWIRKSF